MYLLPGLVVSGCSAPTPQTKAPHHLRRPPLPPTITTTTTLLYHHHHHLSASATSTQPRFHTHPPKTCTNQFRPRYASTLLAARTHPIAWNIILALIQSLHQPSSCNPSSRAVRLIGIGSRLRNVDHHPNHKLASYTPCDCPQGLAIPVASPLPFAMASTPPRRYKRDELLHLANSPLVKRPDGLPPIEEWMG